MLVSEDYPYLEVGFVVRDYEARARAYLDTGFDGYLIVPLSLALHLGSADYATRWEMGDGSLVEAGEYVGAVEIRSMGASFPARLILLGNDFVMGRGI